MDAVGLIDHVAADRDPAAGLDPDAAHRVDELGEAVHVHEHIGLDLDAQGSGHGLERGLRARVLDAGVEVLVLVGDLGVDGVDEAFVAAVVAVRVELAHRASPR